MIDELFAGHDALSLTRNCPGLAAYYGYGQLVMNNIQNLHKDYGIEIVATEKFEVGATDVSTQAAKVRAAEPDVVGVIATSPVRAQWIHGCALFQG